MDLQSLLDLLPDLLSVERETIEKAYYKAQKAHANQMRSSGEPYFTHCLTVAHILAEMKLDAETIAAALLHDILEDTPVTLDELRVDFNEKIVGMVDGVTKLKNLPIPDGDRRSRNSDRNLESIRKMLLAMDNDVRVVLVKLADRLHNMRTLGYLAPEKQKRIAQETMDIYAPLANWLGIWQMKWELEDLSFRYLESEAYKTIAASLDEYRMDRTAYVDYVIQSLRQAVKDYGIEANISGRPKHIYSIYRKMQKKGVPFAEIYDVRAVRVIVNTKIECYQVLGIVHDLWHPIPSEFDDYIANPKDNFYQSLHTAVVDNQGKTVEVQIRTYEMHKHAEFGIAAHWIYKEGGAKHDEVFERRLQYIRQWLKAESDENGGDAREFVDNLRSDAFRNRVYVFTPKGDIVDLSADATPIDFAYYIHTEIGHRCRGAKINGKLVPLNYKLQMGDQVSILTSKRGGPSYDWLNPHLGYVNTPRARAKIRHWFHRQNREKHIADGRELLERERRRLGVHDTMTFEAIAALFDYERVEDFMAAIGSGDINTAQVANRILQLEEAKREQQLRSERESSHIKIDASPLLIDASGGVSLMGQGGGGLLMNLARCCNPVPGDAIIGFITRGRGIMVHRRDCTNITAISEQERLVDVDWHTHEEQPQRYAAHVEIVAYDRGGLMRDVSSVIADENVSMSTVNVSTRNDMATFHVTLEIANGDQLSRILAKIGSMAEVIDVRRRLMA